MQEIVDYNAMFCYKFGKIYIYYQNSIYFSQKEIQIAERRRCRDILISCIGSNLSNICILCCGTFSIIHRGIICQKCASKVCHNCSTNVYCLLCTDERYGAG
jgi:hypothetical protein